MKKEPLGQLRADASRGDYTSMSRLAQALYRDGFSPRMVVRECYGVDFPEEFFILSETGPYDLPFPMDFMNQPWKLATTNGSLHGADSWEETEKAIFSRDPDLVPLVALLNPDAAHGDLVVCYRLGELEASRTTIYGIEEAVDPSDEIVHCGASLLTVMHEYQTDIYRNLDRQSRQPSNRDTGSVGNARVSEARSWLNYIEELQCRVASRSA